MGAVGEIRVPVEAGEIAAVVTGIAGDPLVLVHGSWVDRSSFDRLAPLLERGLRLIRYDRRGYGASSAGDRPSPTDRDARDLAEVLEHLDLHPAHLVGSSYGGNVALSLAASRPELVRSLILHEPPLLGVLPATDPRRIEVLAAADRVADLVRKGETVGATERFVDEVSLGPRAWSQMSRTTREALVRYAARWEAEYVAPGGFDPPAEGLGELFAPTLVTWGAEGRPVYRAVAESLAGQLPNGSARGLPGTGHLPHLTHPALLAGVIQGFVLERIVPTS